MDKIAFSIRNYALINLPFTVKYHTSFWSLVNKNKDLKGVGF